MAGVISNVGSDNMESKRSDDKIMAAVDIRTHNKTSSTIWYEEVLFMSCDINYFWKMADLHNDCAPLPVDVKEVLEKGFLSFCRIFKSAFKQR